jgi:hypothetical protein
MASRQGVDVGAKASVGQLNDEPLQLSATSHGPAVGRQLVPLGRAVQVPRWPARLQA